MAVSERQHIERPWWDNYPRSVPRVQDYPVVPLYRLLADTAAASTYESALVFFGRRTSYRSLLDVVKRLAGGLVRLGLNKGDRVAIMLPNCPQVVATYYGVLWAGGTVVMVNPLYTASELVVQLKDSGARFMIALDLVYPRVAEVFGETDLEKVITTGIQERLPFPLSILYRLKLRRDGNAVKVPENEWTLSYSTLLSTGRLEDPVPVAPRDDLALLQYTGGTTGTPKAVMLTHFNLVANCRQIAPLYPHTGTERPTILGVLPFFHVYGMTTVMNYGIMSGARIILQPRFEVEKVLKAIQKDKPDLFPGVPAMYVAINNYPGVERFRLGSVKWCLSGAAPLPGEVKETFERLTGGRLVEGYGLSEASPVTHANPLEGVQRSGSIGLPLPDTDCRITDLESGEAIPTGEVGELRVRGPQVMQGYWKQPAETNASLDEGWLRTGDVARMDDDGYFYIVDRKKEMVIVSGYNVYPREVEEVLHDHPAVVEGAVIGVPDAQRGEVVKAFVVSKVGAEVSADEIIGWCRERLAAFKVPREVEFVSELPKSLIGKVLRRVLAEREQSKRAAESRTDSR